LLEETEHNGANLKKMHQSQYENAPPGARTRDDMSREVGRGHVHPPSAMVPAPCEARIFGHRLVRLPRGGKQKMQPASPH
jgi:hypothetical protein